MTRELLLIPVYLAVIALSVTLEGPWAIALQAAMGGFGLGYLLGRSRPSFAATESPPK
jgi:hypothetical protein